VGRKLVCAYTRWRKCTRVTIEGACTVNLLLQQGQWWAPMFSNAKGKGTVTRQIAAGVGCCPVVFFGEGIYRW